MNQLAARIRSLRHAGLHLRIIDSRLKVEPPEKITPDIDDWIREHSREIREFLEAEKAPGLPRPNTTQVPDVFLDEIMSTLNEAELRVMLYIIRRTYGFKRDEDTISLAQFSRGIITYDGRCLDGGTGMKRTSVIRGLRSLEKRQLIEVVRVVTAEHGKQPSSYRLVLKP